MSIKLNHDAEPEDGAVEKVSKNKSDEKPPGHWDSSDRFYSLYATKQVHL